jgi:hypothetical protein
MHQKSERLHEIPNDDLHLLCKSLDLDFRSYMFVLLVFCVCNNDKRRSGNSVISGDYSNSVDSTRIGSAKLPRRAVSNSWRAQIF